MKKIDGKNLKRLQYIEHIEINKMQWREPDEKKELKVINNYRIGQRIIFQGTVVGSWQQCRRWFGFLSPVFFSIPLNQSLPHTNQLKENYVIKTNTP